jgi:aminoglycoside phosphotransferase (APT) family kinase protein
MNQTTETPIYLVEYELFMDSYKKTEVSGEEVGEVVMRMAAHYSRYNMKYADALRAYSQVVKEMHAIPDASGKPISSTKAMSLAEASDQAARYEEAKVHVQNIEQCINALKALQRGVLNEYAHAAL